ncbi:MAG TPA: hypothetical protein VL242_43675, partial [Sorangium sp.]|nr:hypothetical protein [Sorangium sp.]
PVSEGGRPDSGRPQGARPGAQGAAGAEGRAPAAAKQQSQRMVTVVGQGATATVVTGKDSRQQQQGGPARPAHLLFALPAAKAKQVAASDKPALTAREALSARTAKAKQAAAAAKSKADSGARQEGGAGAEAAKVDFDAEVLAAGWDRALEALRAAGDAAPALVDAWIGASNVEAIAAAAEAEDASGAARKAARRALNVLKSRGAAIPTRPRVVRLADDRAEVVEATLIPPDSSGTEAIAITSRDTSGRYRIAEVIVRESVGVLHAGAGWLSGSQLKEGRARAYDNLGTAPVPISLEWARHRIAAAKRQNAVSGQVVPLGLEGCRDLIEPAPETEPRHPVADLEESLTDELVAALVAGSAALHDEPEFRHWLPARPALDELLQKVGQRLGAAGVRDPQLVNTALREEVELATDRFFSPEVRGQLATRMRSSAVSLRARKGDAAATTALAVARAVKEAGLITAPPREIPFLAAFFQKALGVLAQQGGGQLRVPVPAGAAPGGAEAA